MSTDALASRRKIGVIGPSTNTIVQPDYDDLRPAGVTNHYSRIAVSDAQAISDETFMAGTLEIDQNTLAAVSSVMTAKPDHIVMGMSAVTFYGGRKGAAAWRSKVEDACGVGVTIGSEALVKALRASGNVRRVGLISPYYPVANAEVSKFLADHDIEVARDIPLRCPSWTSIAEVTPEQVRDAFQAVDGNDVDALIQVGTNLSALRVAAAGELWLGKPVIAINAATYWCGLRAAGIADPIYGFGRLLERT